MRGFRFNVSCEGFVSFRKPVNTAYLDTYPVPPVTTITGLISNAAGLGRGDLRLQEYLKIGIKNNRVILAEEYCQLLKEPKSYFPAFMYDAEQYKDYLRNALLTEKDKKKNKIDVYEAAKKKIKNDGYKERSRVYEFSSSPMKRMVIVNPCYTIYVATEDISLLDHLYTSMLSPARPLYLGNSDSMADVSDVSPKYNIQKISSDLVYSICEGIHEEGKVIKVPLKFEYINKKANLIYSNILTVFEKYPARLNEENSNLFKFGDEVVYLM